MKNRDRERYLELVPREQEVVGGFISPLFLPYSSPTPSIKKEKEKLKKIHVIYCIQHDVIQRGKKSYLHQRMEVISTFYIYD